VASKQIILFLEMLNFFVKENENLLECPQIFVLQNGTFKIYYLINMCQSRQGTMVSGTMVSMKRFSPTPLPNDMPIK